jgi:CHAT domain-containing protein
MPTKRVVLAEYFTTEDTTLLFIVREDFEEPHVVEIKTPLDQIRQFVIANFGASAAGSSIQELDLDAWQERFGLFVEPIVPWTNEGDIIWLVPHDVLHYLPLHALKIEGGQRHLLERNPVCYTPSASVMKYCQAKRKGRRDRALIFADSRSDLPLLHTREQASTIRSLFDPSTEVFVGSAATKSLLQQRLSDAKDEIDVLHLACHGYFHPFQALRSGVMLAPESNGDTQLVAPAVSSELAIEDSPWNLTAEEIFGLEMRVDLVTLSACQTGVNDRRPGDELIGLTRALIYAGTPSVVVSLWSVEDLSTSFLMRRFYEALREGKNKAESLQQAQLYIRTLTTEDAIVLCQQTRERFTQSEETWGVDLIDEDIARLRFLASDFTGAQLAYQALLKRLPLSHPRRRLIMTHDTS